MRHTWKYYLALTALWVVFSGVPALVATHFGATGPVVFIVYFGGAAIVIFSIGESTTRGAAQWNENE